MTGSASLSADLVPAHNSLMLAPPVIPPMMIFIPDLQLFPPPQGLYYGNPYDPIFLSYKGALVEKITCHKDYMR